MNILGISAYYHDSAACLVCDGDIVAAVQEERFSRIKHDPGFPAQSIIYCLREAAISAEEIDYIVFYDKPFSKFERLLETYLAFAPKGYKSFAQSMPLWIKDKLFQKNILVGELEELFERDIAWSNRLLFSEHHLSHAASAFFPSPFDAAAVLTMDGVGEWTTTSLAVGNGNNLDIHKEIHYPHSLGLLYSAFTYYTGFKVNSGEYKIMGLAPYGTPRFADRIKDNLIHIAPDGTFQLDLSYFDYCTGLTMTNAKFDALFEGPPRSPETSLTQREMDLAASIQTVTEEVVLKLARSIRKDTGERNLCLAGGVALNCVANGRLVNEGIFDNVWIQPAAGDAGGALGSALAIYHLMLDGPRAITSGRDAMKGSYLGPAYTTNEIQEELERCGAVYHRLSEMDLLDQAAKGLAAGKAIGWLNGRMEFGPRALGNRSVLADPRSPDMQKRLNLQIKFRESFRPFAPSVLLEDVGNWFEFEKESPYMLFVAEVRKNKKRIMSQDQIALFGIEKLNVPRSDIPAVTHVDYSARIQTVDARANPKFHALISKFKTLTGCSVLVNTSFNVRGEPIVCTPADAFRCFMGTDLDILIMGDAFLQKEEQDAARWEDYKSEYELD